MRLATERRWPYRRRFRHLGLLLPLMAGRVVAGSDAPPARAVVAPEATCRPSDRGQVVAVLLEQPKGANVTAATVVVRYPRDRVGIRAGESERELTKRLRGLPANAVVAAQPVDSGLRVVLGKAPSLPAGELFTVEFDRCVGAPPPAAADFGCSLEAAAGGSGPVRGVGCSLSLR